MSGLISLIVTVFYNVLHNYPDTTSPTPPGPSNKPSTIPPGLGKTSIPILPEPPSTSSNASPSESSTSMAKPPGPSSTSTGSHTPTVPLNTTGNATAAAAYIVIQNYLLNKRVDSSTGIALILNAY